MSSKSQTEKSRFHSQIGDYWITDAQYINELVCLKRAKFLKKDLPAKFTRHPDWKAFFSRNLRVIKKLLTIYDAEAIIVALKNSGYKWSLHTEFMVDLIEKAQQTIDEKRQALSELPKMDINMNTLNSVPPQRISKLRKILDLDVE